MKPACVLLMMATENKIWNQTTFFPVQSILPKSTHQSSSLERFWSWQRPLKAADCACRHTREGCPPHLEGKHISSTKATKCCELPVRRIPWMKLMNISRSLICVLSCSTSCSFTRAGLTICAMAASTRRRSSSGDKLPMSSFRLTSNFLISSSMMT